MFIKQNIQLTVDAVVFGYKPKEGIEVLLIKRTIPPFLHSWALPGGFVLDDESLEEAVTRELETESGVRINYLEQLYTFGDAGRDPRGRIVSVAYFGLVNPTNFKLAASTDAEDADWFNIKELPELAFDHQNIINVAIQRLRNKIRYEPIGFELLDKKFPIADLEKLYETLLDRPIDRRNFQKKINHLGILISHNEKQKQISQGRPAKLFSFDEERYFKLKNEGMVFEI
ncbi:8-oxo-dGTP diphosphatase [Chitinophaga terrae (ex Kim and Jung 2007)]|uniref:8-oxo-dGTP diphosphatase n=1 Tax=Chitinophaga terrae (ex Kim and Jung 2007) TaxID=408074 RepID=A0A1H4G490_9BACT|nr:NUDIX domain-containing protein [Chitinophaga terrae (ex Kim and Jung 2007)]MDQ0109880.1 8-oxo-dGTP diphosphatase [Chitinophaga terrae (ex Kim and Jung 2007)]GEP92974.1 NUDIX hydrolase [Chitinophaga terrae (ex Kim and Jung 2007)]SEB04364.1 8-oxo-dGTP diphosphatase [Chitinophaga terrae (ex Kim and Jung 2007)]